MMLDMAAGLLRLLPAEAAHNATLALTGMAGPWLPGAPADDPRLAVRAFGLDFPNPIGLAAGFDKDARVPGAMGRLGFGFVECGTVTPRPQTGNPRPRLFRLPQDRAVINRMGFNNGGMEAAARNLERRRGHGIVGINIGGNKDSADRIADYVAAFTRLAPLADYVTVNVSSPNTPGLRGLQNRGELTRLLERLMQAKALLPLGAQAPGGGDARSSACDAKGGGGPPILLKIAPDLDDHALDDIATVVRGAGIAGIIATNTTVARPPLTSPHRDETGGLSGAPLFAPSTAILRGLRARLGVSVTLVGVGGIASGEDAYAKIRAGATLVQLYTGLVYAGPGLVARIKRELAALLARDGFVSLAEAVGTGN